MVPSKSQLLASATEYTKSVIATSRWCRVATL